MGKIHNKNGDHPVFPGLNMAEEIEKKHKNPGHVIKPELAPYHSDSKIWEDSCDFFNVDFLL